MFQRLIIPLNSTQKLSDEVRKKIKKHFEIGYRILCSVTEFSGIAEFILYYNERWAGTQFDPDIAKVFIVEVSCVFS